MSAAALPPTPTPAPEPELSYYTETEYRASTVALRLQLGRYGR